MFNRRLADIVDSLIPYSIWRSSPDVATVARARTLVAVLAFSLIVPFVMLLVVLGLHFTMDKDFTPAMVSLVAILLVLAIQLLLFQATASLHVTGIAFSITFFLSLSLATTLTGGWNSPVIPLLFCTPIMVFLISGWREAEYAVLLNLCTGFTFMLLDVLHVTLPYLMHEENRPFAQGVVWFMACIILMLLFATQKWVHGLDMEKNISREQPAVQPAPKEPDDQVLLSQEKDPPAGS